MDKQLNTRVDGDLKARFDAECKAAGITLRSAIEQAMEMWIAEAQTVRQYREGLRGVKKPKGK